MAIIFLSGFETRDIQEWPSTAGSPVAETTTVRSGNASGSIPDTSSFIAATLSAETSWAIRFGIYIDTNTTVDFSAERTFIWFYSSAGARGSLALPSGTTPVLRLTATGETDVDGSTAFPFDEWVLIEVTWNSTTDVAKVWMNGTLECTMNATALDVGIDEWRWVGGIHIEAEIDNVFIDDVRIDDTDTQIGDGKIVGLFPNANGSDAWDTGGYADVDDWITVVEDDTASEALSTGSPSSATDHVQNTSVYSIGASDTINAVVATGVVRRGTGGGAAHYLRITDHDTPTPNNDDSGDLALGTGYVFKSFISTLTMPTPAQLDSWEIGGVTTGARDFKATATALMIDYTPAGVTDYPLELGPGTYALTGLAATVLHGGFMNGVAGAYALTGIAATFARGFPLDAASGSYAIAGSDMTPLADYLTQADSGAYNLSGIDGTLAAGRLFQADAGSYSISGIDASFFVGFSFNAETGTYSLTGVDITPLVTRVFPADAGAYNITGIDAETLAGYLAVADPGAYSISGIAASFFVGFAFNAETGAYTITGPDATLLADRLASLDPGVYTLTGLATTLERSYILVTDAGSYLITGAAATPIRGFVVIADTGAYNITGLDTTIPADRLASLDAGSYLITGADAGTVYVSIAGVGIYKPIIRSRRR